MEPFLGLKFLLDSYMEPLGTASLMQHPESCPVAKQKGSFGVLGLLGRSEGLSK